MKKVERILTNEGSHWVGVGFPVRTLFSYHRNARWISPFLLLDHAGPATFPPADEPRGVDEHPHRGFEKVTLAYAGGSSTATPAGTPAASAPATCSG